MPHRMKPARPKATGSRPFPPGPVAGAGFSWFKGRLRLICAACEKAGEYRVGQIYLHPNLPSKSRPVEPPSEETVSFTGYFRCKFCDAGGPWKIPADSRMTIMGLALAVAASLTGEEDWKDLPLVVARPATFDQVPFRYATEGEAHLKQLIAADPLNAFLWTRLGNLYRTGGRPDLACGAYEQALKVDEKEIESHLCLAQLLEKEGTLEEAAAHYHQVLLLAREARHLDPGFRHEMVRFVLKQLLELHLDSDRRIPFLPIQSPPQHQPSDEPSVVYLKEFDLSRESDWDVLCGMFLGEPMIGELGRPGGSRRTASQATPAEAGPGPWARAPADRATGRNSPCPCGSGKKYKRCCGRPGA